MRTDSVVVRSERGLASATRMWSDSAVARMSPDERRRIVLLPEKVADSLKKSERLYPLSAEGLAGGLQLPRKPLKDYAITIDGKPATQAELEAVQKEPGNRYSYSMWVKDASQRSSDPRAVNGLLEVTTKRAAKP
jgi:hypothetical protein